MAQAHRRIVLGTCVLALLLLGAFWSRFGPIDDARTVYVSDSGVRTGTRSPSGDTAAIVKSAGPQLAVGTIDSGPSQPIPDAGGTEVSRREIPAGLLRVMVLNKAVNDCETRKLCGTRVCRVWTGSERVACFGSNCSPDDGSCGPGDWCQQFGSAWRCSPDGTAEFGAACVPDRFANRGQRCSRGLPCVAGVCTQPCAKNTDCRGDSTCASLGYCMPRGVICRRNDECLDGRVCVTGVCAQRMEIRPGVLGCLPGDCAGGQVCDGELVGSGVWAECRDLCKDKQCAPRTRCVASDGLAGGLQVCQPTCPCGPGEACRFRANAPQDGTCRPTSPTDPEMSSLFEWEEAFSGQPDGFPEGGQ